MKKMSIIRFKPKNGCMDEFIEASLEFSKDRGTAVPPTHFLMKSGSFFSYRLFPKACDLTRSGPRPGE